MKWTGAGCILILLAAGIFSSNCTSEGDGIDTLATPIAAALTDLKTGNAYFEKKINLKTSVFYRANEYHRAWLKKRRPDKMFDAFVTEVKRSEGFGFDPEDYGIDSLAEEVRRVYDDRKRTADDISKLDIKITGSFFLFTTHLLEGRIRYPGAKDFLWKRGEALENDIALLLRMESVSDLRKELASLHPTDLQYQKLQEALQYYRNIASADTLPPLSISRAIKPGDESPNIPLLRRRLALTDSKLKPNSQSQEYDEPLVESVKRFQKRHGLEPDGIVAVETVRLLNQKIEDVIKLIVLNLERLRWRPHLAGKGEEVVINVPEYMMHVYRDGREKLSMRVVLGAEYTPTPVFHDTLKYVVFSPTWAVPRSIFEKEFLPELRNDAEHFDKNRFVFYKKGKQIDASEEDWEDEELDTSAYRVVENPGQANSLGQVKFIMPNDFSIYLHDTPADRHFSRKDRALSHGCIRLERPEEFALYLLEDNKDWNKERISKAMTADEPEQVNLTKDFPVYIVYRTAWVDDDGLLNVREDVYGHDQRQLARLGK